MSPGCHLQCGLYLADNKPPALSTVPGTFSVHEALMLSIIPSSPCLADGSQRLWLPGPPVVPSMPGACSGWMVPGLPGIYSGSIHAPESADQLIQLLTRALGQEENLEALASRVRIPETCAQQVGW